MKKQPAIFLKVTRDMFLVQLFWAFWFLGILLFINVVNIVRTFFQDRGADNYFNALVIPANLFMLVIGIISVVFLKHFVQMGVTRKDYFKGTFLAAIGLSVVIPIISIAINALQQLIVSNIESFSFRATDLNSVIAEIDSHIIADLVQAIILTPHVDPGSNWFLATAVMCLNMFIYYLVGWLVSAGFQRLNSFAGLGVTIAAVLILMLQDTLLRVSLDLPVLERFELLQVFPLSAAVAGILILILLTIAAIRTFVKRITVKIG